MWLDKNLKGVERINVSSTSRAARMLKDDPKAASISNRICAQIYNTKVIAENIQDTQSLIPPPQSSPLAIPLILTAILHRLIFFPATHTLNCGVENTTRFFVLSARSPPSSNSSRTFLRFMVDHTQPGALCDVLQAL